MFCSTSIGMHLLRGCGAFGLVALSFYVSTNAPAYALLVIPMLIGAVFLLRGCPMCWIMGLVETVANRKAKRELDQKQA